MTAGAQAEAQCPSCGSTEITTDKRYGAKLKISELVRKVLRTPIFWIGIVLVGIGLFYPGFQWRAALAFFGVVLMVLAVMNNQPAVGDGSASLRYSTASHACRQCGHFWTSEDLPVAMALDNEQFVDTLDDQSSATEKTPPNIVTIVGWVALVAGLLFLCLVVGMVLYTLLVGLPT